MKLALITVLTCIGGAVSTSDDTQSGMTVKAMETVFARSDHTHQASMTAITNGMSIPKAVSMLEKSHLDKAAIAQVTSLVSKSGGSFRKQPKGYSGIDGARKLLNDMIFESMSKYDAEIAKCTDYYSKQCAAMEACRGQIAASNYIAANSRSLILDSQSTINQMEVDIPTGKLELRQHNMKCKHELRKMNERLKIVLGDIAIMTMILEMTDCDAKKTLIQTNLLQCQDPCTKKTFVQFNHPGLQEKVAKLQSKLSLDLMRDTFADLFDGVQGLEATEFLQTGARQEPIVNVTEFKNPPVPRTEVPGNPCNDPDGGAPSAADKRAAKCTIKKSPQCYKLQERFLLIQSGIQDERDQLQEDIALMEKNCKEQREILETQISNDESMLENAQTKLATSTEKEATAGEVARMTAAENDQYNSDLVKQMKTCSENYINYETELCALKKIRGELYKMKGGGHSAFFQDCEVSKWDPEECTKVCAGGEQQLTRGVMVQPNGGAKCLPLVAKMSCNNHPCPVDCKLQAWSGWSKCSAECGGGVQQRLREVKRAMKYGGKPCGATSETIACNAQACEKDCELSEWTAWTDCSKDCDGGTQKRVKFVSKVPMGEGKCADRWSLDRLEYKKCNEHVCVEAASCSWTANAGMYASGYSGKGGRKVSYKNQQDAAMACLEMNDFGKGGPGKCGAITCHKDGSCDLRQEFKHKKSPSGETTYVPDSLCYDSLTCTKSMDVVLLIDGSGSLGKEGWAASIKAANLFMDAFAVNKGLEGESKANVAVILFSGPRTWSGVKLCVGKGKSKLTTAQVDPEKFCKIKMVTHFTQDLKKVKQLIDGLEWPQGSTLTSLALMAAKAELSLGNKDSLANVIVFTDGRPLSFRNTYIASRSIRKSARLVWVAVTKFAPLKMIKRWATRRWQENVVTVKSFADFQRPSTIAHVIADICPKSKPGGQTPKSSRRRRRRKFFR